MTYQRYADAMDDAANVKSPTASTGNYEDIKNYVASRFQLQAGDMPVEGAVGAVNTNYQNAQQAKRDKLAELEEKAKAIEKMKEDMADPGKWKKERDPETGGYKFYNPLGEEVFINDYAKATGQKRAEVVKDSEDIRDQQYYQDYNTLESYINAKIRKSGGVAKDADEDLIKDFESAVPAATELTLEDLQDSFQKYYGSFYGADEPHREETFAKGTERTDQRNPIEKILRREPEYDDDFFAEYSRR